MGYRLQNRDATIYTDYVIDAFSSGLFLIKFPGRGQRFSVSDIPIQGVDIAPTILKHFGLSNPGYDGKPIDKLQTDDTRENVFIATTRMSAPPISAARYHLIDGAWRLQGPIPITE